MPDDAMGRTRLRMELHLTQTHMDTETTLPGTDHNVMMKEALSPPEANDSQNCGYVWHKK